VCMNKRKWLYCREDERKVSGMLAHPFSAAYFSFRSAVSLKWCANLCWLAILKHGWKIIITVRESAQANGSNIWSTHASHYILGVILEPLVSNTSDWHYCQNCWQLSPVDLERNYWEQRITRV
jgi:hypothetical protein